MVVTTRWGALGEACGVCLCSRCCRSSSNGAGSDSGAGAPFPVCATPLAMSWSMVCECEAVCGGEEWCGPSVLMWLAEERCARRSWPVDTSESPDVSSESRCRRSFEVAAEETRPPLPAVAVAVPEWEKAGRESAALRPPPPGSLSAACMLGGSSYSANRLDGCRRRDDVRGS